MIMRIRVTLLLIFCAVFSAQVKAQTEQFASLAVEYGDLSELAGKRRVYVHSENLASRGKILKELSKSKYPQFEVVGKIADADFLLVYGTNLVGNNSTSFTESAETGDTTVVYGDMVVLKLIGNQKIEGIPSGNHTRILWYTRRRQTLIRTSQFFRPFQSNLGTSKSGLIASIIGNLLFSHPKLAWLPLSRDAEISAVRDFIKALKKGNESIKPDKKVILPPLRKRAFVSARRMNISLIALRREVIFLKDRVGTKTAIKKAVAGGVGGPRIPSTGRKRSRVARR